MSKVIALKKEYRTVDMLIDEVKELYPDIRSAIVIVIEGENGDLHTHFRCSAVDMAMAGARLLYLAGKDDEE